MVDAFRTHNTKKATMTDTTGYDWAIINDEGTVEGDMGYAEAITRIEEYADSDDLFIARACKWHPGNEAEYCNDCEGN